ncbi:MAG: FliM/FliN family flagellar motor switch protein [Halieaceae bacterium]
MSEALLNNAQFEQAPQAVAADIPTATAGASNVVSVAARQLAQMADVPVTLVFEVARLNISVGQLLELKQSSVLEVPVASLDSVEIRVDDQPIALGDVTLQQQFYGIRIEEFLKPDREDGSEPA